MATAADAVRAPRSAERSPMMNFIQSNLFCGFWIVVFIMSFDDLMIKRFDDFNIHPLGRAWVGFYDLNTCLRLLSP